MIHCLGKIVDQALKIIRSELKAELDEREQKRKERNTLTFSASESQIRDYLERNGIVVVENECEESSIVGISFNQFQWTGKDSNIRRAIEHLRDELTKFGVAFGPNEY